MDIIHTVFKVKVKIGTVVLGKLRTVSMALRSSTIYNRRWVQACADINIMVKIDFADGALGKFLSHIMPLFQRVMNSLKKKEKMC